MAGVEHFERIDAVAERLADKGGDEGAKRRHDIVEHNLVHIQRGKDGLPILIERKINRRPGSSFELQTFSKHAIAAVESERRRNLPSGETNAGSHVVAFLIEHQNVTAHSLKSRRLH